MTSSTDHSGVPVSAYAAPVAASASAAPLSGTAQTAAMMKTMSLAEMMLLGTTSHAGERSHDKSLKLDGILKKQSGDVKVTVKLSNAEAGSLKAKLVDGTLPANVTMQTQQSGAVTLSGNAAQIKQLLSELIFSPNPTYQKDFTIRVETQTPEHTHTHELKMRYDENSHSYQSITTPNYSGGGVSQSIYHGAVASEIQHQDISQVKVAELVGILGGPSQNHALQPVSSQTASPDVAHSSIITTMNSTTPLPEVAPAPAQAPASVPISIVPITQTIISAPSAPLALPGVGVQPSNPGTLTGLSPTGTYTENAVAFVLDNDVTFTDTDSPALNGGKITVGYAAASNAGDALSLLSDALGAGAVRLNGTAVEYSATGAAWAQVGTLTANGSTGANLVITLNGAATPLVAERILEHVTYTSTDDNPPATKAITMTVDDGKGGISAIQTHTLTITPVNDAPTVANAIADTAASVSSAFSFQVPGTSFADPEGAALTYSATKSDNSALPAWLSFNAATLTFTGTPAAPDLGTLSVKVTATDGTLSTSDIFDILVSNGLVASNLTRSETYTEDTSFNLTDIVASTAASNITATLTLSAAAAGSLTTGTSGAATSTYNAGTGVWTATGAKADVNALLASATFVPAANYNANFTIATQVNDGATTLNGTLTMNGTAVNDAPTIASAIPDQMTTDVAGLSYTLPVVTTTFSDVEGDTVSYGALEYYNGTAWTTTLPNGFSWNAGTLTLTVAPGTAPTGVQLRIAGTDNGTPTATGYATFLVGIAQSGLYGSPVVDNLVGNASANTIILLAGNDSGKGMAGNDTIFGGDGNDTLYGDDTSGTLLGHDVIYGGNGNDSMYGDYSGDPTGGKDTLYGGAGNDSIYGYADNDVLYGEDNDDNIFGGTGNDMIDGGAGNDNIQGEAGADTLTGGAGNDQFIMYQPNTESTSGNPDTITDFTQGQDKILPAGYLSISAGNAAASTATALTYEQVSGNTYIYGSGGTFTLILTGVYTLLASDFLFATGLGTTGNDSIVGSSVNDLMYGLDGDDYLSGANSGNDLIWGGNGNDTIFGGSNGNPDSVQGDAGNDVFLLRNLTEGFQNNLYIMDFVRGQDKIYMQNMGIDGIGSGAVQLSVSYNAGTDLTTVSIVGADGSNDAFRFMLKGNVPVDSSDFIFNGIFGSAVGTHIRGTYSGDGIVGSSGNDEIYNFGYESNTTNDNQANADQVAAGDGDDYMRLRNGWARGNLGNDTMVADGSGWAFTEGGNDVYLASSGSNNFAMGSGDDIVMGGLAGGLSYVYGDSGNDLIIGSLNGDAHMYVNAGVDTLLAAAGNDLMDASSSDGNLDIMYGGLGQDSITLGSGNDQIWYLHTNESTGATADLITNFTPTGANAAKIFIHPGTGANSFSQMDFSTTTTIGVQVYTVVKFTVASGLDSTFQILLANDMTATLSSTNFLFGNAPYTLNPAGENYTGNGGAIIAGADYITGSGVDDTISGNGGIDVIYGGAGNDSIIGGPAAGDTFGDEVHGDAGNDTIQGGSWHDTLDGGDNDDRVSGGDGYDSIDGGLGNDTLYGENDSDTLNGGAGSDSLYGGNGIDFLDGGANADKLFGEAGNDFFVYDSADLSNDGVTDLSGGSQIDTLRTVIGAIMDATMLDGVDIKGIERFELANTSNIVLTFAAAYDDGVGVDSIYGGSIDIDGSGVTTTSRTVTVDASALDTQIWMTGGAGNDTLRGGTQGDYIGSGLGNDSILGNNGNDTLGGGVGADTITGGAGNDVFFYQYMAESTTASRDRITDFTNGQDKFNFNGIDFYGKSFADFTVALSGADTTITLTNPLVGGPAFQIILTGDHVAELEATDFLFT